MRAYLRKRIYFLTVIILITTTLLLRRKIQLPNSSDKEVIDYNGSEEYITEIEEETPTTLAPPLQRRSLINASGCQIPDLEALSSVAKQHSQPPLNLTCGKKATRYRVNRSLGVKSSEEGDPVLRAPPPGLKCCYRDIFRSSKNDHKYKYSADCHPINRLMLPASLAEDFDPPEFIRVTCREPGQSEDSERSSNMWLDEKYRDFYSFVPLKDDVEIRCEDADNSEQDQLNVVILGLDSVSRLNMLRQLPETYELLQSISAYTLLGYNKVADNTFPNLMPLLAGHSMEEMKKACKWPENHEWKSKFDSCPIIWKDFADKGYRTMYGEECTHLSTFNFQKAGFNKQPTDYYPRPFLIAAADDIGHTHADNCMLCMGYRTSVQFLLDYTEKFIRRFASERKRHFSFSWATSLTHDGLNMAGLADEPFAKILNRLIERDDLEHTALFFVSDHGVRSGALRLTPQGRLEERLPFLAVSLPEWFKERYPLAVKNLAENARNRLTTPFDIHETLRDLLAPAKFMPDEKIQQRMQDLNKIKPRGMSLFLEIPSDRTCDSAGIPRHWCTCLSYQPLNLDDPGLQNAAEAFVSHINDNFLAKYSQCHPLTLEKVLEARLGVPQNSTITTDAGIKDYALTIQTTPGGGIFEGAVRSYRKKGRKNINKVKFDVADTISRLNRYGSQSDCIKDWVVKLYCFCDETN